MNLSQALITGQGVTLSEALSVGGLTTFIGLLIVFSVLVILMLVLYLFKVIFYKGHDEAKPAVKAPEVPQAVEIETDEDELIAVLTAAVAASLKTSTYNLHIKSYRRIKDERPSWNKEGLREVINSRF